jgi:tetratricopeptide (TPR) repeat protein
MRYYNLILFLAFLTSCIPYKKISIEYYDKPSINLNPNSRNITILTNFHLRDTSSKLGKLDWYLDSVSSVEATMALSDLLERSPVFENNSFNSQSIIRTDTNKVILPLKWSILDSICQKEESSLVISLEYLKVRPTFETYPVWRTDYKEYYGFLDVTLYAYWRIYDVSSRKIALGKLFTDTLSWEQYDWIEVTPGNQLPGVFEACAYAGAYTGEKFSEQLAPQWKQGERVVFVPFGNALMDKAYSFAVKGQWIEAASIWQKLSSSSNQKLAAQASFNMALASEMNGKFELAITWLNEAKKKHPSISHINSYMKLLKERVENNK